MNVDSAVQQRYSDASTTHEPGLCCPVDYDPQFLTVIPPEVLERDYGCGDPVSYVNEGDTVLDLGSGGGKVCFIAAQMAGSTGRVIGVDANDDMLTLAQGAAPQVADQLGYANVEFRKGRIEDLRVDLAAADSLLAQRRPDNVEALQECQAEIDEQGRAKPLVADASVSLVLSNCVLNLVRTEDKHRMFAEIHRVLRSGGRAVISDIVSDEDVPDEMRNDPALWSGCYSGALREDQFLKAFADVGLYGVSVLKLDERPWEVINGIEFRSMTVVAYKGKEGICWDHGEAVIYRGPFSVVADDDGHEYRRGERTAVCRKTYNLLTREPYAEFFEGVQPYTTIEPGDAPLFPCDVGILLRDPQETKKGIRPEWPAGSGTCTTDGCC
jgi:arsenite methyltransferase